MALPMQKTPWYTLRVPSTDKEIQYRPFFVKEQKALLLAQQSEEQKVMLDTLKQVLSDCIRDDLNVDELAIFDLEYMFSQIRAKSVGEIVELILRCDTCSDEKAKVKVSIDLSKLTVDKPATHSKKIELFDDVGIVMKYPRLDVLSSIEEISKTNDIDAVFNLMVQCIDIIYAGDELHHAHEYTKTELIEFLGNLTEDQFKKIQNFFETMPKLEKRLDYKCPICTKEQSVLVSGLDSFF